MIKVRPRLTPIRKLPPTPCLGMGGRRFRPALPPARGAQELP
ncbi:hypothetical protein RA210_U170061 [Rubrivivax sp. A210]|nr:hypothetical protein RA210_U170061 [Rubrivivax sp. A210]